MKKANGPPKPLPVLHRLVEEKDHGDALSDALDRIQARYAGKPSLLKSYRAWLEEMASNFSTLGAEKLVALSGPAEDHADVVVFPPDQRARVSMTLRYEKSTQTLWLVWVSIDGDAPNLKNREVKDEKAATTKARAQPTRPTKRSGRLLSRDRNGLYGEFGLAAHAKRRIAQDKRPLRRSPKESPPNQSPRNFKPPGSRSRERESRSGEEWNSQGRVGREGVATA